MRPRTSPCREVRRSDWSEVVRLVAQRLVSANKSLVHCIHSFVKQTDKTKGVRPVEAWKGPCHSVNKTEIKGPLYLFDSRSLASGDSLTYQISTGFRGEERLVFSLLVGPIKRRRSLHQTASSSTDKQPTVKPIKKFSSFPKVRLMC